MASGGYEIDPGDVAANGDAVFTWYAPGTAYGSVYRWHGGQFTNLTGTASSILTDGINVAYQQHVTGGIERGPVYLLTPSGRVTLTSYIARPYNCAQPNVDYRLANGWTAYTDVYNGSLLVYTRSPTGAIAIASAFPATTRIDGLSDDGTVMYLVNGSRYLGRANGGPPMLVSSDALGTCVYSGGSWYVVMGASLFAVSGAPSGDAGAPDGGEPDAGAQDSGPSDAPDSGEPDASVLEGGAEESGVSDASPSSDGAPPDGVAFDGAAPDGTSEDASDGSTRADAESTDGSAQGGGEEPGRGSGGGGGCATTPAPVRDSSLLAPLGS